MSTTDTTATAADAILPASARKWVYDIAVVLGAVIFVAAIVLDAVGRSVIDGVTISPTAGVIALALAALGRLAGANLSSGPAILDAIEGTSPKAAEVLEAAQTTVEKAQELAVEHPDLTKMLKSELKAEADKLGIKYPGKATNAALIALIEAATKTGA